MEMAEYSDQEARKIYSSRLITLWLECIDLSHEARRLYLRGEYENDLNFLFVARLTRLWRELKPKVENRTELKDLVNQYMLFEQYYIDCNKIKDDPDKILELEGILCDVMDKLGITQLENIK